MCLGVMSVFRALPTLLEAWQLLSRCVGGSFPPETLLPSTPPSLWLVRGEGCFQPFGITSPELGALLCSCNVSYTVVLLSLHQVCGSHTEEGHRALESPLLRVRELCRGIHGHEPEER